MDKAKSRAAPYRAAARRSARAMLAVDAWADAEGVLRPLIPQLRQQFREVDARDRPPASQALLDCSLMLAEALRSRGEVDAARQSLIGLSKEFPKSAVCALRQGQCEIALSRADAAVQCFRRARRLSREGGPLWCRATLDLINALDARGHSQAAWDMARLCQTLYPEFGSPRLRKRLLQTGSRLKESLARPSRTRAIPEKPSS